MCLPVFCEPLEIKPVLGEPQFIQVQPETCNWHPKGRGILGDWAVHPRDLTQFGGRQGVNSTGLEDLSCCWPQSCLPACRWGWISIPLGNTEVLCVDCCYEKKGGKCWSLQHTHQINSCIRSRWSPKAHLWKVRVRPSLPYIPYKFSFGITDSIEMLKV